MSAGEAPDPARRLAQVTAKLRARYPGDQEIEAACSELDTVQVELDSATRSRTEPDKALENGSGASGARWRWQQLFDLAPVAYIVTDAAGLVVEANQKAVSLLRLRSRPANRMSLVLRFAPANRPVVQRMLREPWRRGSNPAPVRLADEDGSDFRGALRCVPVRADRVLWVLDDVSSVERARELLQTAVEREQAAAERLRATDAMRRAFLLSVSHDLRVPLAAIAGFASVLRNDSVEGAERDHALGRLEETAYETVAMLDDLLDYERIDQPTAELHRTLGADVQSQVEQTARAVLLDGHDLQIETTPTSGAIDLVVVERIISNLVRNAVQHTPPGTRIWVRCRREPDGVLLVVEDDGPGIPPERRDVIFDLFQRAHESTGVGAGLALVRRFAQLHGGYARVEARPGGGASFSILLKG